MVAASVANRTSDTADMRFSALSVSISLASWSASGSAQKQNHGSILPAHVLNRISAQGEGEGERACNSTCTDSEV